MSRGKYSPSYVHGKIYTYNCYGKLPVAFVNGVEYDEKTMFDNYDDEGYDSYGYSCFDSNGEYVGIGSGIDRNGYTEMEYMCMSDDEFEQFV